MLLENLEGWVLKTQKIGLPDSMEKWEDSACEETGWLECCSQQMLRKGEHIPPLASLCEVPGWSRGITIDFSLTHNFQIKMIPKQPTLIYVHTFPLEKLIWKSYKINNKEM